MFQVQVIVEASHCHIKQALGMPFCDDSSCLVEKEQSGNSRENKQTEVGGRPLLNVSLYRLQHESCHLVVRPRLSLCKCANVRQRLVHEGVQPFRKQGLFEGVGCFWRMRGVFDELWRMGHGGRRQGVLGI